MKVAVIEVKRTGEGDPLEFAVIVRVGDGETRHHVTMVRDTCERLTAGTHCPSPTVRMGLPRADPVGTLKGIYTLTNALRKSGRSCLCAPSSRSLRWSRL